MLCGASHGSPRAVLGVPQKLILANRTVCPADCMVDATAAGGLAIQRKSGLLHRRGRGAAPGRGREPRPWQPLGDSIPSVWCAAIQWNARAAELLALHRMDANE